MLCHNLWIQDTAEDYGVACIPSWNVAKRLINEQGQIDLWVWKIKWEKRQHMGNELESKVGISTPQIRSVMISSSISTGGGMEKWKQINLCNL